MLFKVLKKDPITDIYTRGFYPALLVKILGNLMIGLAIFYAVRVVHEVSYEHLFFIMCSSTLAFLLGLIAVFAPSGVGVREAILIYLLGTIMPAPIALVATVVIRIMALLGELLFIGAAYLIDARNRPLVV